MLKPTSEKHKKGCCRVYRLEHFTTTKHATATEHFQILQRNNYYPKIEEDSNPSKFIGINIYHTKQVDNRL
jgi:hypothetical protein